MVTNAKKADLLDDLFLTANENIKEYNVANCSQLFTKDFTEH